MPTPTPDAAAPAGEAVDAPSTPMAETGRDLWAVRFWLLVSLASSAVQLRITPGVSGEGAVFLLGVVLLWLIYRHRSRTVRIIVATLAITGGILHAPDVAVAASFFCQALPLLTGPVRRHVQRKP